MKSEKIAFFEKAKFHKKTISIIFEKVKYHEIDFFIKKNMKLKLNFLYRWQIEIVDGI